MPVSPPIEQGFDPSGPAAPDSGIYGLPHSAAEAGVHVIPVPFDVTTSYGSGAARGPEAILRASRQVDLYDLVTGKPYEAGIHMRAPHPRVAELQAEGAPLARRVELAGGSEATEPELPALLERVNAIGAELNALVRAEVEAGLDAGKLACVLGGDHAVPFGSIAAHAERTPGLGVLHFDAHADLRRAYEGFTWSHASILHNVVERLDGVTKLVQVGLRDLSEEEHAMIEGSDGRIEVAWDREWAAARLEGRDLRQLVREKLATLPADVYVTFDVDGLEPALCPHTGTPVPGGLDWHGAMLWLEELGLSGRRVVGLDLVEVAPGPEPMADERDGIDEIVGARLLYRLIGTALLTR